MPDPPTLLQDVFGAPVRLTAERFAHILEHPEMVEFKDEVGEILAHPEEVRRSRTDHSVQLSYARRRSAIFGDKWLCVVVKYKASDAFVVTAYLTDKVKAGEQLWPAK